MAFRPSHNADYHWINPQFTDLGVDLCHFGKDALTGLPLIYRISDTETTEYTEHTENKSKFFNDF